MRPESLVSLSEITSTNGFTLSLAASPGIAANASLHEGMLHTEGILRDAAGELGIVV